MGEINNILAVDKKRSGSSKYVWYKWLKDKRLREKIYIHRTDQALLIKTQKFWKDIDIRSQSKVIDGSVKR